MVEANLPKDISAGLRDGHVSAIEVFCGLSVAGCSVRGSCQLRLFPVLLRQSQSAHPETLKHPYIPGFDPATRNVLVLPRQWTVCMCLLPSTSVVGPFMSVMSRLTRLLRRLVMSWMTGLGLLAGLLPGLAFATLPRALVVVVSIATLQPTFRTFMGMPLVPWTKMAEECRTWLLAAPARQVRWLESPRIPLVPMVLSMTRSGLLFMEWLAMRLPLTVMTECLGLPALRLRIMIL